MYTLTDKDYSIIYSLNRRNDWGFSKNMLICILRKYRKAYKENDYRTMAMIEERLTDANFHAERSLLVNKDFEGFEQAIKCTFEN
jgi:hypothetical protein